MSAKTRQIMRGVIVLELCCIGLLAGMIYRHARAAGTPPPSPAAIESPTVAEKVETNARTTDERAAPSQAAETTPPPEKEKPPAEDRADEPARTAPTQEVIEEGIPEAEEPNAPAIEPLTQGTLVVGRAFAGQPFGVGQLEVVLGDDLDARWRPDEPIFLYEDTDRTRYPAFVTSYRLGEEEKPPHLRQVTAFYLFQGNEPLQLSLKTRDAELVKVHRVPVETDQQQYRQLQSEWWKSYSSDPSALRGDQRQVKEYLVRMLGRRLGLSLPPRPDKSTSEQPMAELEKQFERVISTLFGIDSVLLAIQDDLPYQESSQPEITDRPMPSPITMRSLRWPTTSSYVPVEPIALRVPADCFYLRCGRLSNYLWLRQFVVHWGGSLHEIVSTPALDYQIRETIERQLALSPEISQELSIDESLADMALIGCDILFRDGAAVGALFEAKDGGLLASIIEKQRAAAQRLNPGSERRTLRIGNRSVSLLSTPDNTVRSFYVVDGDYHLVTNSHYIVSEFLQTAHSKRGLGRLDEFRYARRKDPLSGESPIWIYLSDPFFRRLASPHYRIEMKRRARALAELKRLRFARLAAASEGRSFETLQSFVDKGFLPSGFAQRPDGSWPSLVGDTVIDSPRGRPGTFLPIPDMKINKVSRSEVAEYAKFVSGYRRQWRVMDPVIASLSPSPAAGINREKVSLKVLVTPYARERYAGLARYLAPASTKRVARLPNDLLSLEAGLRNGGRSYQVHAGLQDSEVPFTIREGEIERQGDFKYSTFFDRKMYAAVNPAGTEGLSLFSDFTRSLEYGHIEKPSPRPTRRPTSRPKTGPLFGDGGLLRVVVNLLGYLSVSSTIEDRGEWTVMARGEEFRDSILSRLKLEPVTNTAQMRFRMAHADEASVAPYIHAFTYLESRKVSAANAQLLNLLHQQLNVRPTLAQVEAERLLRARLVCPLGGDYQLLTESAAPNWTSTAWTAKSYYDLERVPPDYRFPFLDWLHELDLAFNLTPDTLSAKVELEVTRNEFDKAVAVTTHLVDATGTEERATSTEKDHRSLLRDRDTKVRPVPNPTDVRPGDTIVILDDKAELKVGQTTLARLPKYERLRVVAIERNWIGIFDQKRGKLVRGWVHVRHVGTKRD